MKPFARPDLEEFFRTYSITTFTVSKDEKRIAFAANLSGKYNVWGFDLPNTYPYQLSYQDQAPSYLKFDPQGRYLLAGFDTDGDENVQMYLLSPNGGALTPLRTFPGRRHFFAALSKDGNRVYYASDKENHNYLNGYVYDMETGEERVLYEGSGGTCYVLAVAEDESKFIVSKQMANTYAPAYVHADGKVISLVPDDSIQHVVWDCAFADEAVLFTTDYGEERSYFAKFDLTTGTFSKEVQIAGGDVTAMAYHEASQTVYLVAMQGAEDKLYRYHAATGKLEDIPMPVGVVEDVKIAESGNLYLLGRSDVRPFNLYRLETTGEWTQLSNNRVMGVAPEELVEAEVLRFPSFDGLEIEALWFAAPVAVANGYTVVWPHGGPQAAERRAFRPLFQFLCSRGYNVWAPNFRGSTGYGSKFVKMVEGDWGHGPRLDMMASVDWLIQSGRADRDKLFLVGGSYGGYMTLLLHGRHPEYWRACVDIFGPSNLFTFLNSVPDHWKPAMKQWLGDPVEDKERLTVDSPITYLDHMTRPMLVIQGANDPRVVKAESDQIVAALREKGVDVEYLVFDDEGHGFQKKVNEMTAYGRAVDFLDKHRA